VLELTDSAGATTSWQSGTWLVDPAAPKAAFTSPPTAVTALSGTSYTVRWTETPAAGTHIVSRTLQTERAFQPIAGTCAGTPWGLLTSTTAASPVTSTGLGKLGCFRYRLILTDSAGRKSVTYSGVLLGSTS
jgi:hypothetical protein